jgi:hypothetical protein
MYFDLGCKWISSCCREIFSPQGNSQATDKAEKLQALIRERAALLLYDGVVARSSKDLLDGALSFLKDLTVWEVPDIEIRREFLKRTNIQRVGACVMQDNKKFLLFISGDFDYFDVASYVSSLSYYLGLSADSSLNHLG